MIFNIIRHEYFLINIQDTRKYVVPIFYLVFLICCSYIMYLCVMLLYLVVDAVSIDAEQEKVTVIGKVDPNELIKQLKKSRKQAEICVQKGGENNGNENANGGKKNGNGNASGGENNGNANGGKKNGNGNGNASGGENNGNANGGKKNGNGNGNVSGGKKNGNGNASGCENNGNGNMAQMVPKGWGGYPRQGMQMPPYSNEQLHHMMMMNQQQQQQMNMYPQAMNYVPPPSIPSHCMADHPAYILNDENVNSCRIM